VIFLTFHESQPVGIVTCFLGHNALELYRGFGFESGQYEPAAGAVLFRQKEL
jgi:hypothetical protein